MKRSNSTKKFKQHESRRNLKKTCNFLKIKLYTDQISIHRKKRRTEERRKSFFFSFFAAPLHHTAQRRAYSHNSHSTAGGSTAATKSNAKRKLQKGYIFTVGCSSISTQVTSHDSRLTTHD